MGEIVEFSVPPSNGRTCFKITSPGINFDVKTNGFATLGLTRKPGKRSEVLITIGYDNVSWIKKYNGIGTQVSTPDILNGETYSSFWIQWAGNVISLGKYGYVDPFLKYPYKTAESMYVTFLSHEGNHCVHWRVELPPTLKQPSFKRISKGDVRWVHVDNQLPDDALIGGFEREHLYIIRAQHRGSLTPGKFVPSEGCGYIAWGGAANEKEDLQVLCGYNCEWVAASNGTVPVGAVEAGYSEVRRELLYVGRVYHDGYIIPGKVQPSHKVCYIPYDGKEIAEKSYEVLVVRPPWPCVNRNILPNDDMHYNLSDVPVEMVVEFEDDEANSSEEDE